MAAYDHVGHIVYRVSMGKVREVFPDTGTGLPATRCGIGHMRYSTTGSSCVENAGPFVVGPGQRCYDTIAVAHNGNPVNGVTLRAELPQHALRSTTNSEAIALLLLLQADGTTMRERMISTFTVLRGAYSPARPAAPFHHRLQRTCRALLRPRSAGSDRIETSGRNCRQWPR
jgi:amidophosphoribosyltransferase